MRTLYKDFIYFIKNETFLMLTMILLFSQISGPILYFALLLVPYVLCQSEKKYQIDTMTLLIVIYSFSYSLFTYINGWYEDSNSNLIFNSILPPLFYLIGKYWGRSYRDNLYFILFLIITLLSIKPISLVVSNIVNTGQLISLSRSIEFVNSSNSPSATNIGMQVSLSVSSFGLIASTALGQKEKIYKYLLIIISLLGLLCVVHLINRTGLVIALLSLILVTFFNIMFKGRRINVMYLGLLVIITFLVLSYIEISFLEEISNAYDKREVDGYDTASAGGRLELWEMGIKNMFCYPLGQTDLQRQAYSHNYWLDTAATAGLFPLSFLLIITFKHIISTLKIIRVGSADLMLSLFIVINIGFFLTCFVEPVMEGSQLYVYLLFIFIGITQSYLKK